ncbi:ABC-2 type transport system ATP-binding protein [Sanguibacter antarcticus]|uniref:ABC-2 type transport system ATP-binding protein n=1 Tax=Sanguibacter antarcticus TaxID=372484 RepID=A0A2A9E2F7_9MICO|nr:ABC-2 type transport system ATP-binding protein [Sanguibacter antarcticus]
MIAEHVSQGYGHTSVLADVSIRLEAGTIALLGPNGAGKTTLLRTLATVQPLRGGRLEICGQDVHSERLARAARRSLGYLPQGFGYDPAMSVFDFVFYGAWVRGVPRAERTEDTNEALSYVGLADRAREKMGRLSGGMRQRAGIAWAIVGRPAIALLDEPTVGLDPEQRIDFRNLLRGLTGTAVLLSTHLTDDVDAVCDRVIVMDKGSIIFTGTTKELKTKDDGGPGNTSIERGYISLLAQGDRVA